MDDFFKLLNDSITKYSQSKIITVRMKEEKKIFDCLNDDKFVEYYEEFKLKSGDEEVYSDVEIIFDIDTKINYDKDPIFNLFLFLYSENKEEINNKIIEYGTVNLIKSSFLFACSKGIDINLDIFPNESESFTSLMIYYILESENILIIDELIKNKNFDNFISSDIKDIAIIACNNNFLTKTIVLKLFEHFENVDDVFEEFDIYSSSSLFLFFINSKHVSFEAVNKKFESVELNSASLKIFLNYGVSKEAFNRVFIKVCKEKHTCVGKAEKRIYEDGIKYEKGETISYFYKMTQNHILSRFISSSLMTKEIFNEGIQFISPKFCFFPSLLVNRYTDKEFIKSVLEENEKLNDSYIIIKEEIENKNKNNIVDEDEIQDVLTHEYYDDMEGPHENCNYIENSKSILIGSELFEEQMKCLTSIGVKTIINLTDIRKYKIKGDMEYHQIEIKSGKSPSQKKLTLILDIIKESLSNDKKVYIHSKNGSGRSGLIAAIIYGKLNDEDAVSSINHVTMCRNSRTNKSKNFIPIPETDTQIKFIGKILGVSNSNILPSRDKKDWMKILKDDEKEQKLIEKELLNL